jgi:hypothetical protein
MWAHRGLAVLPNVNLVSNIGFGEAATHTKTLKDRLANLPLHEMIFPLQHPLRVARDQKIDQMIFEQMIGASRPAFYQQLRGKLAAALPRCLRNRS